MNPKNIWNHLATITSHKWLVMKSCFRVGLWKQGLLHDLSKYSFTEFFTGVKFYQGYRSPNAAERDEKGFSKAWLHHKGRNKHHFEYWIDFSSNPEEGLVGHKMPIVFVIEMVMDRIAASKVYSGSYYHDGCAMEYYNKTKKYMVIHPESRQLLESLLQILKDEGEESLYLCVRKILKQKSS